MGVAGDLGATAWNFRKIGTGALFRATTAGAAVELFETPLAGGAGAGGDTGAGGGKSEDVASRATASGGSEPGVAAAPGSAPTQAKPDGSGASGEANG